MNVPRQALRLLADSAIHVTAPIQRPLPGSICLLRTLRHEPMRGGFRFSAQGHAGNRSGARISIDYRDGIGAGSFRVESAFIFSRRNTAHNSLKSQIGIVD